MILLFIINFAIVWSYDPEMSEKDVNKLNEMDPFYHTVVISDIAEIMNEIDNDMIFPYDIIQNNSASDENVEDLLTEYQHYLDKAQRQRRKFLERNKEKNKTPLLRQETFKKINHNKKYNDFFFPNEIIDIKPFQYTFPRNNVVDIFFPLHALSPDYNKFEATTAIPKIQFKINNEDEISKGDTIDGFERKYKISDEGVHPICSCDNMNGPCDCNCVDCVPPLRSPNQELNSNKLNDNKEIKHALKLFPYFYNSNYVETSKSPKCTRNILEDLFKNVMDIRMKIDIQLPMNREQLPESCPNCLIPKVNEDLFNPPVLSVPYSYYNFLTPFDGFGQTNVFKIKSENYNPMHKFTIHKKKKFRSSNLNKKHRKKGAANFQTLSIQQDAPTSLDDKIYLSDTIKNSADTPLVNKFIVANTTENTYSEKHTFKNLNNSSPELILTIDVANETENHPSNYPKKTNIVDETTENEIKTTVEDLSLNSVKLREKRETISSKINSMSDKILSIHTKVPKKGLDKTVVSLDAENIATDDELLYWPDYKKDLQKDVKVIPNNNTNSDITKHLNNINNISSLNDIMFKKVRWNDMGTVVPVFMSFFGKYFNGIVTLCSNEKCHTIICNDKRVCLHLKCLSKTRINHRGHCIRSNSIENAVSLEGAPDLTSNAIVDVVELFKEKLQGKIYGKGTLCSEKICATLAASNTTFSTIKCTSMTLKKNGHCSFINNIGKTIR